MSPDLLMGYNNVMELIKQRLEDIEVNLGRTFRLWCHLLSESKETQPAHYLN